MHLRSGALCHFRFGLRSRCRASRSFATHRDAYPTPQAPAATPSLLSQLPSKGQSDRVGPFAMQLDRSPQSAEESKAWSQLSTAGKVRRTTARTTNFGVILFGAGLSAVIVYALATELFATNSPTVLYGDICERMRASPELAKYLPGPLIFHNNPPSPFAPRHRARQVPSQLVVDSSGREHLMFRFWVEGRGSSTTTSTSIENDPEEPFWEYLYTRAQTLSKQVVDQSRRAFAFLVGEPLPSPPKPLPPPKEVVKEEPRQSGWGFAGLFGGIRGSLGGKKKEETISDLESEGEVHVDMVKNERGDFIYRHLFVDIPNSRARKPRRVFVEGLPGDRQERIIWQ